MASSAFASNTSWQWPDEPQPPSNLNSQPAQSSPCSQRKDSDAGSQNQSRQRTNRTKCYPPRTCRICLETVAPTYEPSVGNLASFVNPTPSVSYISADPAAGRLIRPCKCKGSSRYVHEGCLQTWRHADPAYGKRNYWQCPTCNFRYRLERMAWASWISSTGTQVVLTLSILYLAIFLLGFVGDPIINLYLDPYNTVSSVPLSTLGAKKAFIPKGKSDTTWTEHLLKGLASLGLLGFIKVILAMSPWQWWNLRSSGLLARSGRATGSGRERLASISWIVVLVGVGTFVWGVYKTVSAWSRRWLEKAGERVLDVQLDGDEEYEEEYNDENATRRDAGAS